MLLPKKKRSEILNTPRHDQIHHFVWNAFTSLTKRYFIDHRKSESITVENKSTSEIILKIVND